MPTAGDIIFWISLIIITYTYAGYPLLLIVAVGFKKVFIGTEPLPGSSAELRITLIVAAYNEAEILEEKIRNTMELDYPADLLDIIFITDGCTDTSNDIISRHPQIKLLYEPPRKGKVAALNRAMEHVTTPIVVFSDANGFLNEDCLQNMARYYSDASVGGVTGEKKIIVLDGDNAASQGEGLYWKYESSLKKLDSQLYSTVGAAGEIFSMRTSLYTTLPENTIIEDFVQSLLVCQRGYRVRYEPLAISSERGSFDIKEEMERKIRISAGAFQAMGMLKSLFNIVKFPVLSFQFFSHRIMRWTLAPLALPLLYLSNCFVFFSKGGMFNGVALVLQTAFYLLAAAGWITSVSGRSNRWLNIPFYFTFMHFCVYPGFYRFLTNKQSVVWSKGSRTAAKI